MSSEYAEDPAVIKNLLQQTAQALEDQFRSVIFDQDRRAENIEFQVRSSQTQSCGFEIHGRIEFQGDLEEVLELLRASYPFQIVQASASGTEPTLIEATLSPWVLAPGWEKLGELPAVFILEIFVVEAAPTIPFPIPQTNSDPPQKVREVIFLIHGIRDRARWQALVKRILEEVQGVVVVPIKYGYFDVFRFWLPVLTRGAPIRFTQRQIQIGKNEYRVEKYSVIAHSFGTYTISKVLQQTQDLVLERLVLCGCIIPSDYPWEHLSGRINNPVINDYGTQDVWPFWARKLSWGYGDTGRYGFGRSDVMDRAHDKAHGDYFEEQFIRDFWKPLFETGIIQESQWEEQAPKPGWIMETLSFMPLKMILLAILTAIAIYTAMAVIH